MKVFPSLIVFISVFICSAVLEINAKLTKPSKLSTKGPAISATSPLHITTRSSLVASPALPVAIRSTSTARPAMTTSKYFSSVTNGSKTASPLTIPAQQTTISPKKTNETKSQPQRGDQPAELEVKKLTGTLGCVYKTVEAVFNEIVGIKHVQTPMEQSTPILEANFASRQYANTAVVFFFSAMTFALFGL